MTTLAALLGALPLVLESGTGSELRLLLGVSVIGRKRRIEASMMASFAPRPCACRSTAKSTIMMAFFFTMPISITSPMMAITDRSMP